MLCARCHKVEATVHFTVVVGDKTETVDLCKDCAPGGASAYPSSLKELQHLSIIGKTCEFCGQPAVSGEMTGAGSATYWCIECGAELSRVMSESLASARKAFVREPELQAWAQTATASAISVLKERKRRSGGNPNS